MPTRPKERQEVKGPEPSRQRGGVRLPKGNRMLMAGNAGISGCDRGQVDSRKGPWRGVERDTTERGALTPDLGHPDALWGWPQRLLW